MQLAHVRRDFDWAIPGYRNILSIISDTTYEDRRHFLLELIQNADDAKFSSAEDPSLKFVIHNDSIELKYNEEGFTVEDVLAITDSGSSTKTDAKRLTNSFIGEKGIGFKSVFALASSVEIHSPPWHFILEKDECVIPKLPAQYKSVGDKGTSIKIFFDDPVTVNLVANELKKYVEGQVESFLFLQNISEFILEDCRNKTAISSRLVLSGRKTDKLFLEVYPQGELREYTLYSEEGVFPEVLVRERWEKLGPNVGSLKRQMAVAALADTTGDEMSEGRLFCFLPTEVRLPVPVFLQVDGHTKADRERLQDAESNNWNRHLFKLLPDFLLRALLHWRRDPNLSKQLPNYIPTNNNQDQLAPVFDELYQKLKNSSWVLTYETGESKWVTPEETIRFPTFWHKWFAQCPDFRRDVEALLEKKIMHPDWMANPAWDKKWNLYSIAIVNEQQIIEILSQVTIPIEILKDDDNFIKLYSHILNLRALKSNFKGLPEDKEKLLKAKIFPLESKQFGALYEDGNTKLFWMNVRSKRKTGLEELLGFSIVNPEYTYRPEASSESSKERQEEVLRVSKRNSVVCELLKKLGVLELSDDTLLSEVQIPWLLDPSNASFDHRSNRLKVLQSIFNSYRAKRVFEPPYLDQLKQLSRASFCSSSGQMKNLEELILPKHLRLKEIDKLYEDAGLDELHLPYGYLYGEHGFDKRRHRRSQESWRDFLIYCGIRSVPVFKLKETKFYSPDHFSEQDKERYDRWCARIRTDFTTNNPITIQYQVLDSATQKTLSSTNYCAKTMARLLNEAWMFCMKDSLKHINLSDDYYRHVPPPGYFKAIYKRRFNRQILIEEGLWGGIDPSLIPLQTVSKKVTSASECRKIEKKHLSKLVLVQKYFNLVVFAPVTSEMEGPGVYHEEYLNSIPVNPLSMADINSLWGGEHSLDSHEIIKMTLEILSIGVSGVGLKLYDFDENRFRKATDFKLGWVSVAGFPLIEEQYPECGKKLGELLGLETLNEVTQFIGFISSMIDNYPEREYDKRFHTLLIKFGHWSSRDCNLIQRELSEAIESKRLKFPPVVVVNNVELLQKYRDAGIVTFELKADPSEKYLIEAGFRQIGFIGPEDVGELLSENSEDLPDSEFEQTASLLEAYSEYIEEDEASRLVMKFGEFKDFNLLIQRVCKAKNLIQVYQHSTGVLSYELPLPYYDGRKKQFYMRYEDTPETIVAFLLYSLDALPSIRLALQEIKAVSLEAATAIETRKTIDEIKDYRKQKTDDRRPSILAQQGDKKMHGVGIEDVADRVKSGFKTAKGEIAASSERSSWRTALDPETEAQIRSNIGGETLIDSLRKGPEVLKKRLKKRLEKEKKHGLHVDDKLVDSAAIDPREFLRQQYRGICQSCHVALKLANGKNYFEILRIVENRGREWWADRPFNILCLCPNCHALAKYGGRDFSAIYSCVLELLSNNLVPEEVKALSGDFYVIPVTINQVKRELVFSPLHINYIATLFETSERYSRSDLSASKEQTDNALYESYKALKAESGRRPCRVDLYRVSTVSFKKYIRFGWLRFLYELGELNSIEESWLGTAAEEFLIYLEKTPMVKSYKIPVINAFLNQEGGIFTSVSLSDIGQKCMMFYTADTLHQKDFTDKSHAGWEDWDLVDYSNLAKRNPVRYLCQGRFFHYDENSDTMYLDQSLYEYSAVTLAIHMKDVLEYRRHAYFSLRYS